MAPGARSARRHEVGEWAAVAVMVLVPLGIKLWDAIFPKGRHFKFMDRWLVEDDDDEDEEDE